MAVSVPIWPGASEGMRRGARQHVREIQRAKRAEDQQHAEQESEVADAIHPEGFVSGIGGGLFQEEEADQQVAAQSHAFPADEHQQVVGGQHQHQHEKHEEIQVREKSPVARIVMHVAGGINVNQPAHAGDHQQHDDGELVHLQREVRAETARGNPREVRDLVQRNLCRRAGTETRAPLRARRRKASVVEESATPVMTLFGQRPPKMPLAAAPSSGSSGMIQR